MELTIFAAPVSRSADYGQYLRLAQAAETLGYDGFVRGDHYWGEVAPGSTDAWVTLAGLVRETSSIRLGVLVTPATFRHPGSLAIQVAQVDQMSGGRVDFGLGAGWYEPEHRAYGFDFPPPPARFDDLTDQLAIITGMWGTPIGETFSYTGKVHSVTDSPGLPKPVQQPVPIVMGGGGAKRTPALTAQYAAESNVGFAPVTTFVERKARVEAACAAIKRQRPMRYSVALVVCAGRTEADVERRAAAIGRDPSELRGSKTLWRILTAMNTSNHVLYLIIGRRR